MRVDIYYLDSKPWKSNRGEVVVGTARLAEGEENFARLAEGEENFALVWDLFSHQIGRFRPLLAYASATPFARPSMLQQVYHYTMVVACWSAMVYTAILMLLTDPVCAG